MSTIRWEDMVFMNRNQSYGAYLLRKAYPGRVNLSFTFAMITVTLILASPSIKAMFVDEESLTSNDKPVMKVIEMQSVPPIEMPVIPPPRVDLTQIRTERFVPPRVTDTDVDQVLPTNAELSQANISDDTGDGVTFVETPAVDLPPATVEKKDEIYTWVEMAPEFPGGYKEMMKFIGKNTKYPATARRMGIEGPVYISFIVDVDGTITNVKTDKGISGDCDEEAMRVVSKMPKWKPGRQGGNAVKVRFVLPIKFTLGGA